MEPITEKAILRYTDTTAKVLFILPVCAVPLRFMVDVDTVFNAAGNDLVSIGIATDTDKYVNDLDVSSLGSTAAQALNSDELTTQTPIVGIYAYTSTAPTTGQCTVYCEYLTPFS